MWIPREIEGPLAEAASTRPALILTGCRQTGKTSLFARVFPDHQSVSLDVPTVAEEAELSGAEFLTKHAPPLIVDEIQYAPTLLRYIKHDIDTHRAENGRFLITGSQEFPMMRGVTESLAGRSSIVHLHSLSAREYEAWSGDTLERRQLLEWMFKGGYPELHVRGLDPIRFYSDYVATYLERDVRTALQVRNLRDFNRFMRLCAARTGQLLSLSSFAVDIGVSPTTIRSWLSVLEASNIVCLLEPYYRNLGKRIVKSPKLYFMDTGLACSLTGMRSPADLEQSPLLGAFFETHVLGQIVRHFANRAHPADVYFYRDHYGREVDFILPAGDRFQLIECKWSESPSPKQRGFEEIRAAVGSDCVISETIVTPSRGQRRLANGVIVGDSVELAFMPGCSG